MFPPTTEMSLSLDVQSKAKGTVLKFLLTNLNFFNRLLKLLWRFLLLP